MFLRPGDAPEAVGLWEATGREVGYGEVAGALREGFAEAFGVEFEEAEASEREQVRARELMGRAPAMRR